MPRRKSLITFLNNKLTSCRLTGRSPLIVLSLIISLVSRSVPWKLMIFSCLKEKNAFIKISRYKISHSTEHYLYRMINISRCLLGTLEIYFTLLSRLLFLQISGFSAQNRLKILCCPTVRICFCKHKQTTSELVFISIQDIPNCSFWCIGVLSIKYSYWLVLRDICTFDLFF